MRGGAFCYFHAKLHQKVSDDDARFGPITLPVLEDAAAITAVSEIVYPNSGQSSRRDPKERRP
jgi:hypothetical protein